MIPVNSFNEIIDRINRDLTLGLPEVPGSKGFVDRFVDARKALGRYLRRGSRVLFKNADREYVINEGGGTEIQYQLNYYEGDKLNPGSLTYGLGWNTQYVPHKNELTPVDYMQPFANAYAVLRRTPCITDLFKAGFTWIYGSEAEVLRLRHDNYCMLGRSISIVNGQISDSDYQRMLTDLSGPIFNAYCEIFKFSHFNLKSKIKAMNNIESLRKLLEIKKNVILQGAPGTGKTYTTAALAVAICRPDFTDFEDREAVRRAYDELRRDEQLGFCTFHQSMDYEDFVEGIKPQPIDAGSTTAGLQYEVVNGIFKDMAQRASANLMAAQAAADNKLDVDRLFAEYCDSLRQKLDDMEADGQAPMLPFHPKSRYRIMGVGGTERIPGIVLATEPGAPTQSLSLTVVRRDFQDFLDGKIQSYKDIRPSYKSKSTFHGNSIYYFELYKHLKEFMDKNSPNNEGEVLKNYVLIIDEINRGNVSKIFGELITLLEPDKRIGSAETIELELPYSKTFAPDDCTFGVPANLYIIATMNTTDRSVGSIDYAVRRRFAFVTLKADLNIIKAHYQRLAHENPARKAEFEALGDRAAALFSAINGPTAEGSEKAFVEHHSHDFDIEDLRVGHSYFMANDAEELSLKLQYEIIPLLREYVADGLLTMSRDRAERTFKSWLEEK